MSSFPWDNGSTNQCGCGNLPTRKKRNSIFSRIAGATGQWIRDLLGAGSGQLVVRNDDELGYLKPNCEGFAKIDTDGNVSVETPSTLAGAASGNPMGFGYLPFLELFTKEICNPDGGPPTEAQWMRIKALMPQLISTGEIAVLTAEECASEKFRFDLLQPCPLPANGCPPDGLGFLASHVVQEPGAGGCCKNVRRWYWVTGLSINDTSLIRNPEGTVNINPSELPGEESFLIPVLRKRGGCWFFESMTRNDLVGQYYDGDMDLLNPTVSGASSYDSAKQSFNIPAGVNPNARWAIVSINIVTGSVSSPPTSTLAVMYGYYGEDQTKEIIVARGYSNSGSQSSYVSEVVDLPIIDGKIALRATVTMLGSGSNASIRSEIIGYR